MKTLDHCRWQTLLFALMAMLLLGSPVLGAGSETRLETSGPNGLKGILTFAAAPLQTMTEIPFSLELYTAEGTAVVDALLAVDFDMPAMPMPKNSPVTTWQRDAYRGVAVFTMAGAWQVKVRVNDAGGGEDRLVFDVAQVMMK